MPGPLAAWAARKAYKAVKKRGLDQKAIDFGKAKLEEHGGLGGLANNARNRLGHFNTGATEHHAPLPQWPPPPPSGPVY